MEVVYSLHIEAFRCAYVLHPRPKRAYRPGHMLVSKAIETGRCQDDLPTLEQNKEKACEIQSNREDHHDIAKPFGQFRWKYS